MFTYCLNNPINYIDIDGRMTASIKIWTTSMWWLCSADGLLPIGEFVYVGGIIVLGAVAAISLLNESSNVGSQTQMDVTVNATPQAPTPNNNDDNDEDDDYYDDDSNFGGREKIGKSKGGTPGNNKAQNKQFKDATKGLPKSKQRQIHDLITKKQFGYEEIAEIAEWYR